MGRIIEDQAEGLSEIVSSTSCLKPRLTVAMAFLIQEQLARAKPAREEMKVTGRRSREDHWAETLELLQHVSHPSGLDKEVLSK